MPETPPVHPVETLWRECGLPEWFLGNGGTNTKLYVLYERITNEEKPMTITAHIDRQKNKTIDGVTFTNTHTGQKKAYGDSFYEYDVTSELPASDVERICSEKVYKAMSEKQYKEEYLANRSADNYFRASYKFQSRGEGRYFYSVCFPYTD